MRVSSFLKSVSFLLSLLLCVQFSVSAAPESIYSISVNEKKGRISQRWMPQNHKTEDKPYVIVLRDAHESFTAQKNISSIIRELVPNFERENTLVGVEGAVGSVNVDGMRAFPLADAREKTADKMVKQGYLTGAEHALVSALTAFDLWGIEDKDIFQKNFAQFYYASEHKDFCSGNINMMKEAVANLKVAYYSDAQHRLSALFEAFQADSAGFNDYYAFLEEQAQAVMFDLSDYTSIFLFREILQLEAMIDENRLAEESAKAAEVTGAAVDNYFEIHAQLLKQGSSISDFPMLSRKIQLMKKQALLSPDNLIRDLEEIYWKLMERIAASSRSKEIIQIERDIRKIENVLQLRAVPEDVEYIYSRGGVEFLSELVNRVELLGGIELDLKNPDQFDEVFKVVRLFYEYAHKRDQILCENLLKELDKRGRKFGIMVVGGYHSDGICSHLREKGIPYVVITPNIGSGADDSAGYFERMSGELVPISPHMKSLVQVSRINATIDVLSEHDLYRQKVMELFDQEWTYEACRNIDWSARLKLIAAESKDEDVLRKVNAIYRFATDVADKYAKDSKNMSPESIRSTLREFIRQDKALDELKSEFTESIADLADTDTGMVTEKKENDNLPVTLDGLIHSESKKISKFIVAVEKSRFGREKAKLSLNLRAIVNEYRAMKGDETIDAQNILYSLAQLLPSKSLVIYLSKRRDEKACYDAFGSFYSRSVSVFRDALASQLWLVKDDVKKAIESGENTLSIVKAYLPDAYAEYGEYFLQDAYYKEAYLKGALLNLVEKSKPGGDVVKVSKAKKGDFARYKHKDIIFSFSLKSFLRDELYAGNVYIDINKDQIVVSSVALNKEWHFSLRKNVLFGRNGKELHRFKDKKSVVLTDYMPESKEQVFIDYAASLKSKNQIKKRSVEEAITMYFNFLDQFKSKRTQNNNMSAHEMAEVFADIIGDNLFTVFLKQKERTEADIVDAIGKIYSREKKVFSKSILDGLVSYLVDNNRSFIISNNLMQMACPKESHLYGESFLWVLLSQSYPNLQDRVDLAVSELKAGRIAERSKQLTASRKRKQRIINRLKDKVYKRSAGVSRRTFLSSFNNVVDDRFYRFAGQSGSEVLAVRSVINELGFESLQAYSKSESDPVALTDTVASFIADKGTEMKRKVCFEFAAHGFWPDEVQRCVSQMGEKWFSVLRNKMIDSDIYIYEENLIKDLFDQSNGLEAANAFVSYFKSILDSRALVPLKKKGILQFRVADFTFRFDREGQYYRQSVKKKLLIDKIQKTRLRHIRNKSDESFSCYVEVLDGNKLLVNGKFVKVLSAGEEVVLDEYLDDSLRMKSYIDYFLNYIKRENAAGFNRVVTKIDFFLEKGTSIDHKGFNEVKDFLSYCENFPEMKGRYYVLYKKYLNDRAYVLKALEPVFSDLVNVLLQKKTINLADLKRLAGGNVILEKKVTAFLENGLFTYNCLQRLFVYKSYEWKVLFEWLEKLKDRRGGYDQGNLSKALKSRVKTIFEITPTKEIAEKILVSLIAIRSDIGSLRYLIERGDNDSLLDNMMDFFSSFRTKMIRRRVFEAYMMNNVFLDDSSVSSSLGNIFYRHIGRQIDRYGPSFLYDIFPEFDIESEEFFLYLREQSDLMLNDFGLSGNDELFCMLLNIRFLFSKRSPFYEAAAKKKARYYVGSDFVYFKEVHNNTAAFFYIGADGRLYNQSDEPVHDKTGKHVAPNKRDKVLVLLADKFFGNKHLIHRLLNFVYRQRDNRRLRDLKDALNRDAKILGKTEGQVIRDLLYLFAKREGSSGMLDFLERWQSEAELEKVFFWLFSENKKELYRQLFEEIVPVLIDIGNLSVSEKYDYLEDLFAGYRDKYWATMFEDVFCGIYENKEALFSALLAYSDWCRPLTLSNLGKARIVYKKKTYNIRVNSALMPSIMRGAFLYYAADTGIFFVDEHRNKRWFIAYDFDKEHLALPQVHQKRDRMAQLDLTDHFITEEEFHLYEQVNVTNKKKIKQMAEAFVAGDNKKSYSDFLSKYKYYRGANSVIEDSKLPFKAVEEEIRSMMDINKLSAGDFFKEMYKNPQESRLFMRWMFNAYVNSLKSSLGADVTLSVLKDQLDDLDFDHPVSHLILNSESFDDCVMRVNSLLVQSDKELRNDCFERIMGRSFLLRSLLAGATKECHLVLKKMFTKEFEEYGYHYLHYIFKADLDADLVSVVAGVFSDLEKWGWKKAVFKTDHLSCRYKNYNFIINEDEGLSLTFATDVYYLADRQRVLFIEPDRKYIRQFYIDKDRYLRSRDQDVLAHGIRLSDEPSYDVVVDVCEKRTSPDIHLLRKAAAGLKVQILDRTFDSAEAKKIIVDLVDRSESEPYLILSKLADLLPISFNKSVVDNKLDKKRSIDYFLYECKTAAKNETKNAVSTPLVSKTKAGKPKNNNIKKPFRLRSSDVSSKISKRVTYLTEELNVPFLVSEYENRAKPVADYLVALETRILYLKEFINIMAAHQAYQSAERISWLYGVVSSMDNENRDFCLKMRSKLKRHISKAVVLTGICESLNRWIQIDRDSEAVISRGVESIRDRFNKVARSSGIDVDDMFDFGVNRNSVRTDDRGSASDLFQKEMGLAGRSGKKPERMPFPVFLKKLTEAYEIVGEVQVKEYESDFSHLVVAHRKQKNSWGGVSWNTVMSFIADKDEDGLSESVPLDYTWHKEDEYIKEIKRQLSYLKVVLDGLIELKEAKDRNIKMREVEKQITSTQVYVAGLEKFMGYRYMPEQMRDEVEDLQDEWEEFLSAFDMWKKGEASDDDFKLSLGFGSVYKLLSWAGVIVLGSSIPAKSASLSQTGDDGSGVIFSVALALILGSVIFMISVLIRRLKKSSRKVKTASIQKIEKKDKLSALMGKMDVILNFVDLQSADFDIEDAYDFYLENCKEDLDRYSEYCKNEKERVLVQSTVKQIIDALLDLTDVYIDFFILEDDEKMQAKALYSLCTEMIHSHIYAIDDKSLDIYAKRVMIPSCRLVPREDTGNRKAWGTYNILKVSQACARINSEADVDKSGFSYNDALLSVSRMIQRLSGRFFDEGERVQSVMFMDQAFKMLSSVHANGFRSKRKEKVATHLYKSTHYLSLEAVKNGDYATGLKLIECLGKNLKSCGIESQAFRYWDAYASFIISASISESVFSNDEMLDHADKLWQMYNSLFEYVEYPSAANGIILAFVISASKANYNDSDDLRKGVEFLERAIEVYLAVWRFETARGDINAARDSDLVRAAGAKTLIKFLGRLSLYARSYSLETKRELDVLVDKWISIRPKDPFFLTAKAIVNLCRYQDLEGNMELLRNVRFPEQRKDLQVIANKVSQLSRYLTDASYEMHHGIFMKGIQDKELRDTFHILLSRSVTIRQSDSSPLNIKELKQYLERKQHGTVLNDLSEFEVSDPEGFEEYSLLMQEALDMSVSIDILTQDPEVRKRLYEDFSLFERKANLFYYTRKEHIPFVKDFIQRADTFVLNEAILKKSVTKGNIYDVPVKTKAFISEKEVKDFCRILRKELVPYYRLFTKFRDGGGFFLVHPKVADAYYAGGFTISETTFKAVLRSNDGRALSELMSTVMLPSILVSSGEHYSLIEKVLDQMGDSLPDEFDQNEELDELADELVEVLDENKDEADDLVSYVLNPWIVAVDRFDGDDVKLLSELVRRGIAVDKAILSVPDYRHLQIMQIVLFDALKKGDSKAAALLKQIADADLHAFWGMMSMFCAAYKNLLAKQSVGDVMSMQVFTALEEFNCDEERILTEYTEAVDFLHSTEADKYLNVHIQKKLYRNPIFKKIALPVLKGIDSIRIVADANEAELVIASEEFAVYNKRQTILYLSKQRNTLLAQLRLFPVVIKLLCCDYLLNGRAIVSEDKPAAALFEIGKDAVLDSMRLHSELTDLLADDIANLEDRDFLKTAA